MKIIKRALLSQDKVTFLQERTEQSETGAPRTTLTEVVTLPCYRLRGGNAGVGITANEEFYGVRITLTLDNDPRVNPLVMQCRYQERPYKIIYHERERGRMVLQLQLIND